MLSSALRLCFSAWMSFLQVRVGTMESTFCCTYAANQTYRDYRLTTGSIAGHELNRCSMVSRAPSKTSPGTIL